MENKELTCICCPMGCALNIEMENRRNHKKDKKERRKSNERSTNLGKSKS